MKFVCQSCGAEVDDNEDMEELQDDPMEEALEDMGELRFVGDKIRFLLYR